MQGLIDLLKGHFSSISLSILLYAGYLFDGNALDEWLPLNGKPLAVFSLLGVVLVYELSVYRQKETDKKLLSLNEKLSSVLHRMEINRLVQAVNGLHGRFETSGDEYITNEYTIKELNELIDMRERLNVNSYTQGKLEYLITKIKR